ncbi:MAG: hypothetical protein HY925_06000 [Elusimicrobia bacterium]|nr:hypothetical protein [Elusimicrobiota bacterium]
MPDAEKRPSEPELVQSGTFLVDRTRALQRLRDYQFQDPKAFLLPWARCAVLSGATTIWAQAAGEGVVLSFDGKPFDAARLKEPYAALFGDEPDGERWRHLAVGLLAALRLQPASVTVTSGAALERHRLSVYSLEQPETLSPFHASAREARTEIEVKWPESLMAAVGLSAGAANADGAIGRLRAAAGMLKIPLLIDGKAVPTADLGDWPSVRFEEDGARHLLVAKEYGKPVQLHLYRQGIRVGTKPLESALSFSAHVDDDRFNLDASHGQVVDDGVVSHIETIVSRHADELLFRMCEEQSKVSAAQTRDSLGVSALTGLPLAVRLRMAFAAGVRPLAGTLEKVRRESLLAEWLRRAAIRRLELTMIETFEVLSPALKALWDAPLYVSVTGKPLSLFQLAWQWRTLRRVPYSNPQIRYPDPWVFGFEPSVHILWLTDENDPCLRGMFGRDLKEWGAGDTALELLKLGVRKVRGA